MPETLQFTSEQIRNTARTMYAAPSNDSIEVDADAEVHLSGDEQGHWVAAWVYVRHEEVKE